MDASVAKLQQAPMLMTWDLELMTWSGSGILSELMDFRIHGRYNYIKSINIKYIKSSNKQLLVTIT